MIMRRMRVTFCSAAVLIIGSLAQFASAAGTINGVPMPPIIVSAGLSTPQNPLAPLVDTSSAAFQSAYAAYVASNTSLTLSTASVASPLHPLADLASATFQSAYAAYQQTVISPQIAAGVVNPLDPLTNTSSAGFQSAYASYVLTINGGVSPIVTNLQPPGP